MVGVYRQTGEEVVDAQGTIIHSDNNRSSQIMYSPDGYIGVVSTPAGRKKTSAPAGRTDLAGRHAGGARRCDPRGDLLRRPL